ncbi:MAG TPA: Chromate resistance protein ChrB [Streptosporangiaceae bacterium]|nr:Chromate resistance protein ChrB [Streptosporangiaceae bacterium]
MSQAEDWVLLAYRLPRVPSTPRSAVWRKLKRLGVVWLGDGLVALPADPRTREQLEWIAEEVTDNGGEAVLWLGRPLEASAASAMAGRMTAAAAAEYDAVAAEADSARTADPAARHRAVLRLRRELRRIQARDFFTCPQRDRARRAVEHLAAADSAGVRT